MLSDAQVLKEGGSFCLGAGLPTVTTAVQQSANESEETSLDTSYPKRSNRIA